MLATNLFRVGSGVAAVLVTAWVSACSSSSSSPSSSSGELADASFSVDSGSGSSGGEVDSSAGIGDGGPTDGGGTGGDFTTPGVGLANFYDAPLDLCIKPQGASDYTAASLYGAEGGVAVGSVGAIRPVPVGAEVKFTTAGTSCAQPGIYTPGTLTSSSTPRVMMIVRKQPLDDARTVFMRPTQHVAGKDNVYYGRLGRDATFTPAGGAPVTIDDSKVTALDPNVTGSLLLTAPAGDYTRPLKTAAGVSLIIETPTAILLCDLLAPPTGHLLRCGDSVRAP